MRLHRTFLIVGSLLSFFAGCTGQSTTTELPSTEVPTAGIEAHAHPSEGPHHGTLVELGSGEYHAEITHDTTSLTIYILDGQAKQAVPIEAEEVTINLTHDGQPAQFKLSASPQQGDPTGTASRFTAGNAELVSYILDEAASAKLSLTIAGTPYRGDIRHNDSHDHSAHDHAH